MFFFLSRFHLNSLVLRRRSRSLRVSFGRSVKTVQRRYVSQQLASENYFLIVSNSSVVRRRRRPRNLRRRANRQVVSITRWASEGTPSNVLPSVREAYGGLLGVYYFCIPSSISIYKTSLCIHHAHDLLCFLAPHPCLKHICMIYGNTFESLSPLFSSHECQLVVLNFRKTCGRCIVHRA